MVTESAPLGPWHSNLHLHPVHHRQFARTYRARDKASRLRHLHNGMIHPTCDELAAAHGHPTPAPGPQPRHSNTPLVEFDWVHHQESRASSPLRRGPRLTGDITLGLSPSAPSLSQAAPRPPWSAQEHLSWPPCTQPRLAALTRCSIPITGILSEVNTRWSRPERMSIFINQPVTSYAGISHTESVFVSLYGRS
jgi:hypothetical protein